jgi:anti-anti-sigma regulatory factor
MGSTLTQYGNVTVLAIKDELAGDEVESFMEQTARCTQEGRHDVVVDCTELIGVDSRGLEALVDLQNACEGELGEQGLRAECDLCEDSGDYAFGPAV